LYGSSRLGIEGTEQSIRDVVSSDPLSNELILAYEKWGEQRLVNLTQQYAAAGRNLTQTLYENWGNDWEYRMNLITTAPRHYDDGFLLSRVANESASIILGKKQYELSNHLGNVLAVVSDKKIYDATSGWAAQVLTAQDYYPFGMTMPGRFWGGTYRYGFQQQEFDEETQFVNFKFRMYDFRIGRFFAIDPMQKEYPFYSPYVFSGNIVINAVELEGLQPGLLFDSPNKAADNFGRLFNDNSIRENIEYYTEIYEVTQNGVAKFAYAIPVTGTRKDVPIEKIATIKIPDGSTSVAWAHTHGRYEPIGYDTEKFSEDEGDKGYAKQRQMNAYVSTALGKFMLYDFKANNVTELDNNHPKDDGKGNAAPTTTSYTVQKGNTLYSIAKKFHTTVDAIKKENDLKTDLVKVDQILNITN
jgi:RHS repeat-associated protein